MACCRCGRWSVWSTCWLFSASCASSRTSRYDPRFKHVVCQSLTNHIQTLFSQFHLEGRRKIYKCFYVWQSGHVYVWVSVSKSLAASYILTSPVSPSSFISFSKSEKNPVPAAKRWDAPINSGFINSATQKTEKLRKWSELILNWRPIWNKTSLWSSSVLQLIAVQGARKQKRPDLFNFLKYVSSLQRAAIGGESQI